MLKRTNATLILALLTYTVAYGIKQPGPAEPAPWEKFSSPEGRFTLLMPAKPTVSTRDVDTKVGKLTLYSYAAGNSVAFFGGSFADYPTAARDVAHAEEVLDGVRDGVLKGSESKLISEKKISVKGHPGREFTASGKVNETDVIYAWRIYLVDRRLYQLAVGTLVKDSNHPDVAKFLTSFDLITNTSASNLLN
jgi:hypothetical protein